MRTGAEENARLSTKAGLWSQLSTCPDSIKSGKGVHEIRWAGPRYALNVNKLCQSWSQAIAWQSRLP